MPGRLNIFQQTMLQWTGLHPYNAVHVARLPAALDLARLGNIIRHTLERLGLTGLTLDAQRKAYAYEGGPAQCEIRLVSESDTHNTLVAEIEQQLNTRFDCHDRFDPFRFFVVPEREGFALGMVYFHVVADAEAVVFLLKRMVQSYLGADAGIPEGRLEVYPAPRDGLLRHPAWLAKKLSALPGLVRNTRRSCRPSYRDAQDGGNSFILFSLPPDSLSRLIQAGKSWGVTINDLFLALLLRSLAPLAARAQTPRRRQMSLGCIVNLRRDLGLEGPRTFGLFLGSFIITQPIPVGIGLKAVAAAVHEQTGRVKRQRLYLTSALELGFARRMLGFFSTQQRKKLYQKNYPLWGGVTNMNLNALWPQPSDGSVVEYFRAVCTGPATPLVLSVTTLRETVNVGLSYRRTVYSAEDIGRLQSEMLSALSGLEISA